MRCLIYRILDSIARIKSAPVVLDWIIDYRTCEIAGKDLTTYACKENSDCYDSDNGPGYRCSCYKGYEGNPYLSPGCHGNDTFSSISTHSDPASFDFAMSFEASVLHFSTC